MNVRKESVTDYPAIKSICEGRELPAYEAASEFTAKIGAQLDKLLPELGGEDGTLKTLEKLQAARNQAQKTLSDLLSQMQTSGSNPTLENAVIDAANQAESKTQQTEAVAKMADVAAAQNKAAIRQRISAAVGAATEKAKEVQTILDAWSDDPGMAFSLMPFCQKIYRTSELAGDEIVRNVIAQRV